MKKSMKYLIELMKCLYGLDIKEIKVDSLKGTSTKESRKAQELKDEIQFSTRRLLRIKTGIRLEKVMEEQLEKLNYDID